MTTMMIYAIYDNVAEMITGPLQLHGHDAPAIRMFSEVIKNEQTAMSRNPQDYDLVRLGQLNDNHETGNTEIIGNKKTVVITGTAIKAATEKVPDSSDPRQLSVI